LFRNHRWRHGGPTPTSLGRHRWGTRQRRPAVSWKSTQDVLLSKYVWVYAVGRVGVRDWPTPTGKNGGRPPYTAGACCCVFHRLFRALAGSCSPHVSCARCVLGRERVGRWRAAQRAPPSVLSRRSTCKAGRKPGICERKTGNGRGQAGTSERAAICPAIAICDLCRARVATRHCFGKSVKQTPRPGCRHSTYCVHSTHSIPRTDRNGLLSTSTDSADVDSENSPHALVSCSRAARSRPLPLLPLSSHLGHAAPPMTRGGFGLC
jgi:hypothetical protein